MFSDVGKPSDFPSFLIKIVLMLLGNCPLDSFRCRNKRCVKNSRVCDGLDNCSDNSDEIDGCSGM